MKHFTDNDDILARKAGIELAEKRIKEIDKQIVELLDEKASQMGTIARFKSDLDGRIS